MSSDFEIEILCNWQETAKFREQWNKLYTEMDEIHPFSSYEWFENWFLAYCNSGDERVGDLILRNIKVNKPRLEYE